MTSDTTLNPGAKILNPGAKILRVSGTLFGAFVPVVSVLVGGGITYWLNVLARRRAHVEDQFNTAIAAVAVADASRHYLRSVGRPVGLSDAQYRTTDHPEDITAFLVEAKGRATRRRCALKRR
jgi:hypothetical protein